MWETALFCNNIYCLLLTFCPAPPRQPPSRAHGDAVAAAVPRSLRVPAVHGAAHQRPSQGCQQPPGTISAPLTLHPSVLRRPALGRGGRWAPTVLQGHPRTPVPPPPGRSPPVRSPSPAPQRTRSEGSWVSQGFRNSPGTAKPAEQLWFSVYTHLCFQLFSSAYSAGGLCAVHHQVFASVFRLLFWR